MRKYSIFLRCLTVLLYVILLKDWAISRYYLHRLVSDMPQMTDQETVDYVRGLVNSNTVHLPFGNDDPRTTNDRVTILGSIYRGDMAATTCGPRAAAMRSILDSLDFETRAIHVFTDDYQEVRSHTFLEVKVDGLWQAQDPDFNVHYLDVFGQRANSHQILMGAAVPIRGWVTNEPLHNYFEILMYDNRPDISLMIVNRARFDLGKYFSTNKMTFLEFARVYGGVEWQTLRQ